MIHSLPQPWRPDPHSKCYGYVKNEVSWKRQAVATTSWQVPNCFPPDAPTICHNLLMCGRYRLVAEESNLIEEYFDTVSGEDDWTPRYNIAPTQPVPIIRQNPKEPRRELSLVRWGLIPSWAKDMSGAAMMINARSETAATKPAFRDPLTSRRCLDPSGRILRVAAEGQGETAVLL